jgi:hypothetical protein
MAVLVLDVKITRLDPLESVCLWILKFVVAVVMILVASTWSGWRCRMTRGACCAIV